MAAATKKRATRLMFLVTQLMMAIMTTTLPPTVDGLASPTSRSKSKILYKHLFRHYDDVSFDSYVRCFDPADFFQSVGYSPAELLKMEQDYPKLLEQSVHAHAAPKVRFLVETLQGGTGDLNWLDFDVAMQAMQQTFSQHEQADDEEACPMTEEEEEESIPSVHSMRLSQAAKVALASTSTEYWSCLLDRTVGPWHAYLVHHNLPHGPALLQDELKWRDFLATKSRDAFGDLCNRWDNNGQSSHTVERVEAFERVFCPGLLPVVRPTTLATAPYNSLGNGDGNNNHNNNNDDLLASLSKCRLVELLVQHGANYLEKDPHTAVVPLYWAAGAGQVDAVRILWEAHVVGRYGRMQPVDESTTRADQYTDVILEEQIAKCGATPFHWACCGVSTSRFGTGGSYNVCRYFLEQCGERRQDLANAKTYSKSTPLMWAAWGGSLAVVDLLAVHGADPHALTSKGQSAAHWAAAAGHLDVCQYLYDTLKLDFHLADADGHTPLHYAKEYGRTDIVDWLESVTAGDEDEPVHREEEVRTA